MRVLFKRKQPNPGPKSPNTSFMGLITLWTTIQQPITPRSGTKQLGATHMPQSPLKLFKLANPKPVCPASLILSLGNYNKCSCPQFPVSWSNPVVSHLAPMACSIPWELGSVGYNKLPFQLQLFTDVLPFLYLNNDKTC